MGWICLAAFGMALFVTGLYAALVVASDADDQMEIRADDQMEFEAEKITPKVWVRYQVPLDDTLQQYIEEKCREYQIPSSVVMAIIGIESNYDPGRIGDNGNSFGLMQIWETCHHDRCVRLGADNLLSPYQNVTVGIDYLAWLLDKYDGDYKEALSEYNNDFTGTYAKKVLDLAECLSEGVMPVTE